MKKFLVDLKVDENLPKLFLTQLFHSNCVMTVPYENLQEHNEVFVIYDTKPGSSTIIIIVIIMIIIIIIITPWS